MAQVKIEEINALRNVLTARSYYDEKWLEQFVLVANWVNSFSNEKSRLLEVGCGVGMLSQYLTAQYAGIDPIEHKDLCKGIDFKIAIGEKIPYPDKSFDYVLIKDAINYFAVLGPFLTEASRVLADNGAILVTEFVGRRYHPRLQKLKNLIKKHLWIKRNMWDATYLNFYTSHDVKRLAEHHGFSVEYRYVNAELRYCLILRKTPAVKG